MRERVFSTKQLFYVKKCHNRKNNSTIKCLNVWPLKKILKLKGCGIFLEFFFYVYC